MFNTKAKICLHSHNMLSRLQIRLYKHRRLLTDMTSWRHLPRVATSCSQRNGTVQVPKGRSLRPEGPKNEAEGRGGDRVLGDGAASPKNPTPASVSLTMRSENGTFAVPFASPTGRGTNWLKNGTSRQKRDGWQPYICLYYINVYK